MTTTTQPSYNRLKQTLLQALLCLLLIGIYTNAFSQNAYELKKDHFYKTFKKGEPKTWTSIVHAQVMLDEKMTEEFFYQGREQVLQPLLQEMNLYLDSLDWSQTLTEPLPKSGKPYLFVGSSEAESAPPVTMMMREDHDMYPPMAMYLEKGSKEWRRSFTETMKQAKAEYAILTWIGLTEYPKANKGVFKKKVVLGTGYEREIRFLSAVDKPVEVLQVTGLLLDKEGNVLRAGAEGFLHEDSPFWVQALEAGTTIDDNAINKLFDEQRREDLPGNPLAWRVAIHNLMEQLTQRPRIM